jgi:rod shape-determining protein MreC
LFIRGPSASVRVAAVVIASIALMTADHRSDHLNTVRSVLETLVYPIQYAVDLPIRAGEWVVHSAASREKLLAENERLKLERLQLRAQLERLVTIKAENKRLRGLLRSSVKTGDRVLIAELLSVDMDPFSRRIMLNKGRRDGVYVGQSIIDSQGVMGQIISVGPFSSSALLITDPAHAVPVQVHRTGLRAVATGTGAADVVALSHIPNNADVRVGDLLVTSGLGGRFTEGYPVGRVVSVKRDSGQPFAEVSVEPLAHLERNREVLLVWSNAAGQLVDSVYRAGSAGTVEDRGAEHGR